MRGYITLKEKQRIQQVSVSNNIGQKQYSNATQKKSWIYKIVYGVIAVITLFSALLIDPCLHDSIFVY